MLPALANREPRGVTDVRRQTIPPSGFITYLPMIFWPRSWCTRTIQGVSKRLPLRRSERLVTSRLASCFYDVCSAHPRPRAMLAEETTG